MSVHNIATFLVIVGALNWGLVGAFNTDAVAVVTGNNASLTKFVYVLVGLAALYVAWKKLSGSSKPKA